MRTEEAGLRHVRVGLRSERGARRVNLRPERAYIRLGMAKAKPDRLNSRLGRADLRLERVNLRLGRVNLRFERACLRLDD